MLYTACFREAEKYPGEKWSIARSQGRHHYKPLKILWPTWDMVQGIKQKQISEVEYTRRYYAILDRIDLQRLKNFVEAIQERDIVLLCHEAEGQFCHRRLVVQYLMEKLGLNSELVEVH
jgi:uncharacterized protein (DUF488 family)